MEELKNAVLPLYSTYNAVERRVHIAQNIAMYSFGRQEMSVAQLISCLRVGMGITEESLDDSRVVAAIAELPCRDKAPLRLLEHIEKDSNSKPEFATIRNVGLISNSRNNPSTIPVSDAATKIASVDLDRRFRLDDLVNTLAALPPVLVYEGGQATGLRRDPHPSGKSPSKANDSDTFAKTVSFPVNKGGPPLSSLQYEVQVHTTEKASSKGTEESLSPSRPSGPRPSATFESPRSPTVEKRLAPESPVGHAVVISLEPSEVGEESKPRNFATTSYRSVSAELQSAKEEYTSSRFDCNSILDQFRSALMEKHKAKHGEGDCTAIWRLRQMFQVLDLDHDSTVDINEFQQAIGKLGLGLTPRDVQMLFLAVDSNSDGSLKAAEFVDAVRGGTIAERRRALLDEAFQKLDKSGDGILTIEDLRALYGQDAKDFVLECMLDEFKGSQHNPHAVVTKDDFYNYYDDLTSHMKDQQFEQLVSFFPYVFIYCLCDLYYFSLLTSPQQITNSFHLRGNTTDRRVYVTYTDGRPAHFSSLDENANIEDQAAMIASITSKLHLKPGDISYVDAHSAGQGGSMLN
jgi:Ca2+-binding EF-hand superfamily protein